MSIAEKLTTIAENEQKVFDAGKDAEWNRFWDAFQQNGNRTNYRGAFYGEFAGEAFYPKYDIRPGSNGAYMMFSSNKSNIDFVERLELCKIEMDFSQITTDANYLFSGVTVKRVGVIDLSNLSATKYNGLFNAAVIDTIDLLIVNEDSDTSAWFTNCSIKNITFGGTIGKNTAFSGTHTLTIDSLKSLITHLKNYKGTEYEGVYSVKLSSTLKNLLNAEGATSPSGGLWLDYIEELGWTL